MPEVVRTGNGGAKRKQLPQIPKDEMVEFIRYVQTLSYPGRRNPSAGGESGGNQYNVGYQSDVSAFAAKLAVKFLKPIQNEFNAEKVKGMLQNIDDFKNDVFIVSKDNEILDGHHRWAALKQWNPDHQVRVIRVDLPIKDLVRAANDFEGSHNRGITEVIRLRDLIAENTGYSINIEQATVENSNYRKVLHTTSQIQLVLMSISPGEEIGAETHPDTSQFIRVESGAGLAVIDETNYPLSDGVSIIIPPGANHNVINTGEEDLKLYSIYSPPEHPETRIQRVKPAQD